MTDDIAALVERLAKALSAGPSDARIGEIKRTFNYKYFGDYEMSDDQRQAVEDSERAMDALAKARFELPQILTALRAGTGRER